MGLSDQKYRPFIGFGTSDKKKVDSIRRLSLKKINAYTQGINSDSLKYDALLTQYKSLQWKSDSLNAIDLKSMIKTSGWPVVNKKLTGHLAKILLHMQDDWIKEMYPILKDEAKSGRMKPLMLANMYDKYLIRNKKPALYNTLLFIGRDGKISESVPEDYELTNNARVEIGLKPLKRRASN